MLLEDIGFYTLSDDRAKNVSIDSPLWRCELLLTDKCTFKCPYCRGMREDLRGTLTFKEAKNVVDLWIAEGLRNVRFSGGEPTVWKDLVKLVAHCKKNNVEKIAVSTNGYSDLDLYKRLIDAGVNDFSISLDACCAAVGDRMAGRKDSWDVVVKNIKEVSQLIYTTVGMVFTKENIAQAKENVLFADSLGISDIRVVPSAQYNKALKILETLPSEILDKYPILRYRINNVKKGRNVRKMTKEDSGKCWLVLDDAAIAGGYHFPCIIYLREGGNPIGKVGDNMRKERENWMNVHNCWEDKICREMCLDVCIDYNNKVAKFKET